MRRARVFVLVGLGGLCAAAPSAVRAAQVSIDAPQSCLDRDTLVDEVSDLVGRPLAAIPDVDFRVEIAALPQHGWRLRLQTLDSRSRGTPEVRGSREIDGATCAELAEAAAVAISVSLRSIDDGTSPAPARSASTSAPAHPGAAAPAAPVAPALAGSAPSQASWHPTIVLAFAADRGALPQTGLGVDLEGHLQRGALRLAVLATGFGSEDASRDMNGGGAFRLLLGGALGCWGPRWGRWTPLACAGLEVGRLSGTGIGVARPETGSALWRAGRGDLGVSAAVAGNIALLLRAGVVVPLARPAFVLDQSQLVYRPSRVTARLTAGLELDF